MSRGLRGVFFDFLVGWLLNAGGPPGGKGEGTFTWEKEKKAREIVRKERMFYLVLDVAEYVCLCVCVDW